LGGYVFLFGGDDYTRTTDIQQRDKGGGYVNDVWVTRGPRWTLNTETTRPLPHSKVQWENVIRGEIPPAGVTYDEWIACQEPLRDALPDPLVCDLRTSPPGKYLTDNMWS
ncbi:unnamed protein product, partial [Chrysoparadoxa australica]